MEGTYQNILWAVSEIKIQLINADVVESLASPVWYGILDNK